MHGHGHGHGLLMPRVTQCPPGPASRCVDDYDDNHRWGLLFMPSTADYSSQMTLCTCFFDLLIRTIAQLWSSTTI
jgi:hypothetical protein